MKLLMIVQRYGSEVDGGAELYCRWLAEHLLKAVDVTVLTTTARDYTTWDNYYQPGKTMVNNVPVIRMPVSCSRNMESFNAQTKSILAKDSTTQEQNDWLKAQGPWSPDLFDYLETNHNRYDLLLFTTYLYITSVKGTTIAPEKSLLIPTAHDEPVAHLPVFHELYKRVAGLFYLTEPEKTFVEATYPVQNKPAIVLGTGVDLPHSSITPESVVTRHNLKKPFLFYMGRVEAGKGCLRLIERFLHYRNSVSSSLKLVLAGRKHIDIPNDESIIYTGFIPDNEVKPLLQASDIVVVPSAYESLSILLLQAFSCRRPVLANADSPVLKTHCINSNGGLFYSSDDEFSEALSLLENKPDLRHRLGSNGYSYVQRNFTWTSVIDRFVLFCSELSTR